MMSRPVQRYVMFYFFIYGWMLDQGNMSDQIRLDYRSGTVQSDHQPHNHYRFLPLSTVSCPADLLSPSGDNRGIRHLLSDQ